ncbi:hypothetical protein [Oceanobacillus halophilus]|uniref:PhoD-like phosphatase metallophosphatase domain-containing protein n=1 Tax=Oceanobacillus halophilus TaxID=930130 RepID=A0A494ZWZ8_9BACI|nr:hypothetical protein [Oceanobacillus halophilus]RKQ30518.1 hypothetical protein D8M06_15580 [Oceanobacillus halophilus]
MRIPFLLAGPIIRRTEPTQVTIWLATSKDVHIEAVLYTIDAKKEKNNKYHLFHTKTFNKTIRAGKRMYIHLIKISPEKSNFPTDHLLGYNLLFTNGNDIFDLGDLDLLSKSNPDSIVYDEWKFPTFYIQEKLPANILYGSCQKPHGKGDNAFISADFTTQAHHSDLKKRPSALFLMGDQIYADDVGDPVFPAIQWWSDLLIGENTDAITEMEPLLKHEPFLSSINKVQSRQYIMSNFANFTSGNAANHMIRFGEYAVLYLLTMGPSLWLAHDSIPTFEELTDNNNIYFMYTQKNEKNFQKELKQHKKRYEEEKSEVLSYLKTLAQTRRIMANTPTYMIFDDHDITDDWNISFDWAQNVYQSSLGKHTVANGLSAYLLFQAWGNDPENLDKMIDKLSPQLPHYLRECRFEENWIQRIIRYERWSFVAPTKPRSLFLDIRTKRNYELQPKPIRVINKMEEEQRAAQLIGEHGWRINTTILKESDWQKGDRLIIVSPTPLYGVGIIESFLKRFVYPLRILGIPVHYDLDFEAWKYNEKSFSNFLNHIINWQLDQCIILSGDVHYASAVKSQVSLNDQKEMKILQFTSSPIRNMSFSGLWGKLLKIPVWLNSFSRKHRTIYRSCNEQYTFSTSRKVYSRNKKLKWREEINYLSTSRGSVILTDNNIGLVTIDNEEVSNKLLQFTRQKEEVRFKD